MVIIRDIEKVKSSLYGWQQAQTGGNEKETICLDTETTKGKVTILADNKGNWTDIDNFKNTEGLFHFLSEKRYKATNNFFFNAQYDFNAIIKWLEVSDRQELFYNGYLEYNGYALTLIEKKEFKIGRLNQNGKVHQYNRFYDISQFLTGKSLAVQSANTPYPKDTSFDVGNGIDITRYHTDQQYHDDAIKYCIQDCKATQHLAINLVNQVYKMGVAPRNWHSKASIAKKYVLFNLPLTKMHMPSRKILQDSLMAVRGGFIECVQMGTFKNVYAPDVRSCYPSFIREMYNYTGRTSNSKEYVPDSVYSWFNVKINYNHPFLSPLWFPQVDKTKMKPITQHYHVTGDMEVWICKPEYEYFNNLGYDMEILEASHILRTAETVKPFYDIVTDLYNARLEAKKDKDPIQVVIKIILNSIYGLMLNSWYEPEFIPHNQLVEIMDMYDIDTDPMEGYIAMFGGKYATQGDNCGVYKDMYQAGSMYAPHIASHILAGARIKLFTDLQKEIDKGYVISAATDAMTVTKLVSKLPTSNKLGNWDIKRYDELLQYGAGRYMVSKDGVVDKSLSANRGIPLSPEIILKLLNEYGYTDKAPFTKESPVKGKESFINKEYSQHDLFNEFVVKRKEIKPYTKTRHWTEVYNKIDQLFEYNINSRPFLNTELK